MGSRLSRQSSLDNENFSKKRRKLLDGTGESDRGSRGGGDFLFALMLKSDKLPGMLRRTNHSPYMRRVAWIKEIQKLLRDRRIEQATDVLRSLRKVRRRSAHRHRPVYIQGGCCCCCWRLQTLRCTQPAATDGQQQQQQLSVCVQFNVQYLAATGVLLQALTSDLQPGMHPKLSAGYVSYQ